MKSKIFFILAFAGIFMSVSCKNKSKVSQSADFLINNTDIQSMYEDYSEEDLELYKNDPDKVYYTSVGKSIEFGLNTEALFMDNITWELNDKPWDIDFQGKKQFSTTFDVPGLYKITMQSDDGEFSTTKFIRALENSEIVSEMSPFEDNEDEQIIDFIVDNEKPNKWEAVLFQDISNIGENIQRRIWDFGDGTVIPTVGNSVKYSFSKPGAFRVKMCLNLTDKCVSKMVIVQDVDAMENVRPGVASNTSQKTYKPKAKKKQNEPLASKADKPVRSTSEPIDPIVTTPVANNGQNESPTTENTLKENKENSLVQSNTLEEKTNISQEEYAAGEMDVNMSIPATVQVGLPVRFQDLSGPDESIQYRNWYINDVTQNYHQRTVDMVFDQAGIYNVKMCLNYLAKNCIEKQIRVYPMDTPAIASVNKKRTYDTPYAQPVVGRLNVSPKLQSPTPDFLSNAQNLNRNSYYCQSYGKAGLKSEYKCSIGKRYFAGVTVIGMEPKKDVVLHNAKVYGNEIGFVDIIVADEEKLEIGVLKRVRILPGQTTIEFAELALTLKKGKKYEMTISTLPQKSKMLEKLALLNSNNCEIPQYIDDNLVLNYSSSQILYDLKYCY